MASIHFIVNPLRPSIGLRWPYEQKKIEAVTSDVETHISRGRRHAEMLAREAMNSGAKLIVVVGGDTTLNEVINGIYRATRGGMTPPLLTLYPELQRGDLHKSVSLRKSFLEFLEAYLKGEAIIENLDLGEVEYTGDYGQKVRRLFVNCAGFGFSAVIASELSREHKLSRNKWSFMKLVARRVPFYRATNVNIHIDGKAVSTKAEILAGLIHNGRFAGHGLQLSPTSKMNDGKFEANLVFKTFSYRYLFSLFRVFAQGLKAGPFVRHYECQTVEVEASSRIAKKVRIDFDGDPFGYLPARFRVLESALKLAR